MLVWELELAGLGRGDAEGKRAGETREMSFSTECAAGVRGPRRSPGRVRDRVPKVCNRICRFVYLVCVWLTNNRANSTCCCSIGEFIFRVHLLCSVAVSRP